MNHFTLDEHTCEDKEQGNRLFGWNSRSFCNINPENFLFYVKNMFVLVTYNHCMNGFSHLDFKQSILNKIISNSIKIKDKYNVSIDRGYSHDNPFKKERLKGIKIRRWIDTVHYTYSNAAGKILCFSSRVPYMETWLDSDLLIKEYNDWKEYLIKIGLEDLLDELNELYMMNTFNNYTEDQSIYIKETDHLIKSINELINGNN